MRSSSGTRVGFALHKSRSYLKACVLPRSGLSSRALRGFPGGADVCRRPRVAASPLFVRNRDGCTSEMRSEEHTSELQSLAYLVCRLLLEKKKQEYNICFHGM